MTPPLRILLILLAAMLSACSDHVAPAQPGGQSWKIELWLGEAGERLTGRLTLAADEKSDGTRLRMETSEFQLQTKDPLSGAASLDSLVGRAIPVSLKISSDAAPELHSALAEVTHLRIALTPSNDTHGAGELLPAGERFHILPPKSKP